MNDIERYDFWHSEIKLGVMCVHCGSYNTEIGSELEYDDGSDEPTTGNHLVTVYYWLCKDCGDITHTHDNK
jgi:hypothetical protein